VRRAALALLAAALATTPARAQWIAGHTGADNARADAIARAEDGAEIRLWMDEERRLQAAITLAPGLVRLDPAGCPTLQIDERIAEDLSRERHRCAIEGARASVVLGQVSAGQLDSPTLLGLMNGSSLTVRYRLAHAGYAASRFSLKGSKQALGSVLEGVTVTGE
jgi:hypothetical protein